MPRSKRLRLLSLVLMVMRIVAVCLAAVLAVHGTLGIAVGGVNWRDAGFVLLAAIMLEIYMGLAEVAHG